jgi:hypothetical protein
MYTLIYGRSDGFGYAEVRTDLDSIYIQGDDLI